jgi:hypothetical protein
MAVSNAGCDPANGRSSALWLGSEKDRWYTCGMFSHCFKLIQSGHSTDTTASLSQQAEGNNWQSEVQVFQLSHV